MNKKPITQLIVLISAFFAATIGRINWSCPPWFNTLKQKASDRPRQFWGITAGIAAFLLIAAYGYHWYQNLPRKPLVTTLITAPQITPLAKTLVPDFMTVDFGIKTDNFTAQSVAPLGLIGKEVKEGIELTPTIPGTWVWQNDNRLVFTPTTDWPAGQTYTIHFGKKVFAPGTKMEKFTYSFTTLPFQASIAEFKFYQDPVNPKLRQAVATINFNFPVDTKSFENKTVLRLQALKNLITPRFKYTVTYDEHKRTAYLHSEDLPLPTVSRYLELIINPGVKPISGIESATPAVTQNLLIPDASSYFKVNTATASIVRNEQDRPEQVLALETSLGVTEGELNKSLHVYLLPQDYPATATEDTKTNYEWQNPGEVSPDILKLATSLAIQTIPADRDYATLHSYKFKAATPRFIYLKLDKGVRGFGDFVLNNDYVAVIKVPEYPKEIGFLHKGALLALSSEKKLSVLVRGLPAVKFNVARVLPDNINQLITQTQGDFNNPQFINQTFNQQNISEIFTDIQTFDAGDLSKEQYTALDLGKYLSAKTNTGGPQGLFLLQATGWDPELKTPLDVKANRLILITDLGLIVKDNSDGSHDVFVQSITQGVPVANVTVSILGKNGLPILTRTTDVQGRVNFPTLKDFIDEREPTVYLASAGNDVSFIPYSHLDRQLNYSRYDVGGLYTSNQEQQSLTAFLFSDRGIYRPGDAAHIGMIVKQAYAATQAAGLPLEATVTDPRGTTIEDKKFTLDSTGFLNLDFNTSATSPTGQYVVNLYIIKDDHPDNLLGSTTLQVAEFQPDRMRIDANFSTEQTKGWISPTELTAKVGLWNLYGAPATEHKISAKILLSPERVKFSEFPDYIFIDPLLDPNKPTKVFTDTLTDTKTDNNGQAQFDLNLERFDKATYQLTFFAEGFEAEGGRSVTAQSTALVSPLAYFVGYKPDGDLSYIKQNGQRSVHFIAVNPELKQTAVKDLKIQLTALHPVTTLVKKPDGTYQYQSLIQTNIVSSKPYEVGEQGANYTLPTDQIGDFALSILDQNNTELSRFKFSVVGASQLPLAKNAELSVKLNKSEYNSDEDIELQITAPYTGSGLISIERDKVYAAQWFKTTTTSSVQKIHLPKDFQGNGYVNVTFVRDWESPDIFISPLSYSVVPFTVTHENHAIHITLDTQATARPGEPFTMKYSSDKAGKIIVFAVDEGVLQVANYKTPDPLAFFFQKHALEVITQQTLDQILPKFVQDREMSSVGGDGGEAALRNQLNPFKRKSDLPVVFWSGIVDTDNTSRQLVYQVPDYFNGTLRVMAVAVATDAVGSTDKKSEIRGNFVISPNVPTFVAPGDEFEITASVANNIKDSGDAKVAVQMTTTPELEIIGSANQTLTITENREQSVHYKLRARSLLGSATITLVANHGDKFSKMNSTLSVRPASSFVTSINSGTGNDSTKPLSIDRVLYPEYRNVEAAISSSPLILVVGLERYLENFPYGCTEQLTSKALPLLAMANQPWFANNPKAITDKIMATVQMLGQRQMSSGGFSYWPSISENDSNAFASVYAMHFLTEARAQGYNVPNEMIRAGMSYLKDLAGQTISSLDQARIQAYAIYILTRNEVITTNYLTNLQLYLDQDKSQAWKKDIISAYIASSYELMKNDTDANRLINAYKLQNDSVVAPTDFYNSNIADAQYLYLIARHFPDRLPAIGNKLVMPLVTAMNNNEINTVLSGYSSLALSAYATAFQTSNNGVFSITETLSDNQQKTLAPADSTYMKVSVDDLAKKVTFNNPGKLTYFYQLTQAGFDKTLSKDAAATGIEVFREYRDLKGNIIDSVTLGTEIEVHIQVRALNDHYLSNVAIVDLLPGGFEVVRDSVHVENVDYADVREDRVVFFTGLNTDAKEIIYHIKAINTGKFSVPPIFAGSMYDPNVKARGVSGNIVVTNES
ncbi:MAG: alpha-2-macroglobulin [Gammaproteobacteria bacterium]